MRGNKARGGGGYGYKAIKWCIHVQWNSHVQPDKMEGSLKSYTAYHSSENITWTEQLTSIMMEEFKQKPGPKLTIPGIVKEIFLFFTTPLLELIVEESNRYAAECMGPEKYDKLTKITVEELYAYMGFMLLMGIVHLPSMHDY